MRRQEEYGIVRRVVLEKMTRWEDEEIALSDAWFKGR